MTSTAPKQYNVGGVLLPRPFKIRRLGHFGLNLSKFEEAIKFYTDALGFRITDELDMFDKVPEDARHFIEDMVADPRMIFTSNSTDHHALLLAHRTFGTLMGNDRKWKDITFSQITWQVGSLQEVVAAEEYLRDRGVEVGRSGRDMPGGNWAVYFFDPDDNMVELYYGMDQIGWQHKSRPEDMHYRAFDAAPPLPQMSEAAEIQEALDKGIDIDSGWTPSETHLKDETHLKEMYDVGGVLLPRPFKVTGLGPMSMFTERMPEMLEFYIDILGFEIVETVEHLGKRIVYLRSGIEHHTFVLADKALRNKLGLSEHTSNMSIGLQVGSYSQLRDAVRQLTEQGYTFIHGLPQELNVGIDYAAHLLDPDGHLICLYYYMEQIGWDGRPRPQSERRTAAHPWPETLSPLPDTYAGPAFMGPLG